MERLLLDFNNRDRRGWVRVGPAAVARLSAPREHGLREGVPVEVVDAEGNRCLGTVHEDPQLPPPHRWLVELDWSTWIDVESAAGEPERPATVTVAGD